MSHLVANSIGDREQSQSHRRTNPYYHQSTLHREMDPTFFDWIGGSQFLGAGKYFTVAFQNIHGLSSRQQSMESNVSELIDNLETLDVSALCISEHHAALSNHKWRQRLFDSVRSPSGTVMAQLNSGPEDDPFGKLFGGTGIILKGRTTGRIMPGGKGGDPMGRWSYLHLRRPNRQPLTIISVYQVC